VIECDEEEIGSHLHDLLYAPHNAVEKQTFDHGHIGQFGFHRGSRGVHDVQVTDHEPHGIRSHEKQELDDDPGCRSCHQHEDNRRHSLGKCVEQVLNGVR